MKECEKHIDKLPVRESWEGYHLPETQAKEIGFREGWQSALEWFYDQLGYSEEHEELKDLIEKELEETE